MFFVYIHYFMCFPKRNCPVLEVHTSQKTVCNTFLGPNTFRCTTLLGSFNLQYCAQQNYRTGSPALDCRSCLCLCPCPCPSPSPYPSTNVYPILHLFIYYSFIYCFFLSFIHVFLLSFLFMSSFIHYSHSIFPPSCPLFESVGGLEK